MVNGDHIKDFLKQLVASNRVLIAFVFIQYALIGAYCFILQSFEVIDLSGEHIFQTNTADILWQALWKTPFVMFVFVGLRALVLKQPWEAPLKAMFKPENFAHAIMPIGLFFVSILCFGSVKSLIFPVTSYYLDDFFRSADQALHFGFYPHDILHRIFPPSLFFHAMHMCYLAWFAIMYFVLTLQFYAPYTLFSRAHYILSFCMIWFILGNVLATVLGSAGPIFYDYFHGAFPAYSEGYQALLQTDSLWARIRYLLYDYLENEQLFDSNSASATPSMHVSVAALIFFHYQRYGKRLEKVAAFVFFATILVGSIYLLWHYGVDSYLSIALTYGVWRFAEFILRKFQPELT